jgi:hypothetical protein
MYVSLLSSKFEITKTNKVMTHGTMRDNGVKGLMLFSLFAILSMKSCLVNGQSSRLLLDEQIRSKVQAFDDSARKLEPRKYPVYRGAEIAMAFPEYVLKSKIANLDGLKMRYIGTNLGGTLANPIGKIKANVGLYYSDASVPYSMIMLQAAVSANLYFLRLKEVKYHRFEPYASIGFTHQQSKYYGTYLFNSEVQYNYSTTQAPLIGRTGYTQANLGGGVEYHMTDHQNTFIHLFAECNYGIPLSWSASNGSFSGTRATNPMMIAVGVNFGILK